MKARHSRGASTIALTAALSVAILIAALGSYLGEQVQAERGVARADARIPAEKQEYVPVSDADGNGIPDWKDMLAREGVVDYAASSTATTTPEDPAASIGSRALQSLVSGYLSLKEYDQYTPERGETLAQTIATNLRTPALFVPHTKEELQVDEEEEASMKRILEYRADMREAMAPMVDLEAEPEFTLFARFIATGDSSWLDKLSETALRYHEVEQALLQVSVPVAATDVHLRAANALGKFTETLERLVRFSNDPIATMTLLRTYNEAEREFLLAFDALAKFYVQNVGN